MSSQTVRNPVSQLIRSKVETTEDDEPKKKSREDWRKAKELEEARKAGTAPAAVDEEGRDINPHIPQYISNAPWYYGAQGPTLKHQRPQREEDKGELVRSTRKGVDVSRVVTKFRKGACENCGAITHKRKDCLERPRKILAKYAETLVVHDEFVNKNDITNYDEKRDRWSSYDPANHREIVEEYEQVEETKRQLKAEKLKNNPDAEISDDDNNEDKYVDEVDMPGTKVDSKQRITVRNLRIREDTAKYLRNLDPNSAYYDPKTRSMRDNPNPHKPAEESEFAGENFVRFSGDTTKHATAQLFAWEAHGKGVDVHILAEPTKLELLQNEYDKKKEQFKSSTKEHIIEKYGGETHLQAPPKSLLLAQTEDYIEYSRSGKVVKGMEKQKACSIYEEDVYQNNHTSVWGSFWQGGNWGYKCCKSFIKNSYCIGVKEPEAMPTEEGSVAEDLNRSGESSKKSSSEKGRNSVEDSSTEGSSSDSESPSNSSLSSKSSSSSASTASSSSSSSSRSSSDSSAVSSDSENEKQDKKQSKNKAKIKKKSKKVRKSTKANEKKKNDDEMERIKRALNEKKQLERFYEDKRGSTGSNEPNSKETLDDRKRPYNSMNIVVCPTEKEIDEWQRKRVRSDDPMADFVNE